MTANADNDNDGKTLAVGVAFAGGILGLGIIVLSVLTGGCVYRGGKAVDGTSLTVGFNVPGTDGALQINALEYISGMRIASADGAALRIHRTHATSNTYFGVIHQIDQTDITVDLAPTNAPTATTNAANAANAATP